METGLTFRSEDLGDSSSQSSLLRRLISICDHMKQIAGVIDDKLFHGRHVQWYLGKGQL